MSPGHRLEVLTDADGWVLLRTCTQQYGLGYMSAAEAYGCPRSLRVLRPDGTVLRHVEGRNDKC